MSRLDLEKLRIVCDWVQYKNSFRDPVELRAIVNGSASERLEIGVDFAARGERKSTTWPWRWRARSRGAASPTGSTSNVEPHVGEF